MSRAFDLTNLYHNSRNSSRVFLSYKSSSIWFINWKVKGSTQLERTRNFTESLRIISENGHLLSGLSHQNSLFPLLYFGALTMITAALRKTSFENKNLRNCDYFAIIPSCSHSTMSAKYATNGLVCASLNWILGLHSRDEADILVYKTIAKCRSSFAQ